MSSYYLCSHYYFQIQNKLGFCSAAIGPATMVWFSGFHNTMISGTRSRFWGGAFGAVMIPCLTTYLMREGLLFIIYF